MSAEPQAGCTGKQAYDDRPLANRIARKYGNDVYRCPICKAWHIGTPQLRGTKTNYIRIKHR